MGANLFSNSDEMCLVTGKELTTVWRRLCKRSIKLAEIPANGYALNV
jgi:hypothetical protein